MAGIKNFKKANMKVAAAAVSAMPGPKAVNVLEMLGLTKKDIVHE